MIELLLRRRNLLLRKQEELNIRAVCFEADGEQTVSITKVGSAPDITMQYSYDGVNWDAWDLTPLPFGGSTKVYVRGVSNERFGADDKNYNKITFSTDAFVYVSGIVESLLDGENEVLAFSNPGTLRNLFYQQTALRSAENLKFETTRTSSFYGSCYAFTFAGCTNLLYAPKALSIEILGSGNECASMFQDCKSLLTAPTLPATTLTQSSYQSMFQGCTSLISAPKISATKLGKNCCKSMFQGCKSLVNAPELPATTLADLCYVNMFRNCSSLVNAPELPAMTLSAQCYQYMFYGCTSLKTIRCRAKVTASSATLYWMYGVETAGTFYGHSEYGWSTGASGIPSGWTFEEMTD